MERRGNDDTAVDGIVCAWVELFIFVPLCARELPSFSQSRSEPATTKR